MPTALARKPEAAILVRPAQASDLDALVDIEQRTFVTDRIARRGFRRLFASKSATLLVAESGSAIIGYALVLYRARSTIARLYSIAVLPESSGRGAGTKLLFASEAAAREHGCALMRLEVHERNAIAIGQYQKSGYYLFGRHERYYEDKGHALRFEKRLAPIEKEGPPP